MKNPVLLLILLMLSYSKAGRCPNSSVPLNQVITQEEKKIFFEWKQKFCKIYKTEEAQDEAMFNFVTNKREIDAHNKLFDLGLVNFKEAPWKQSDLSSSQISECFLGSEAPMIPTDKTKFKLPITRVPSTVDWVDAGLVGPVVEQGLCGSCWAFAAKGVVEAVLRRQNITTPVSAQQMVDCSTANYGCVNGWPKKALDYLKKDGFTSEDEYMYNGVKENCTYTPELAIGALNETFIIWTKGK
jgi:Papain family cysteine protease